MRKRARLLASALLAIGLCRTAVAAEHVVHVQDHLFSSAESSSDLEVQIGDSVKWVWQASGHDVVGGVGGVANNTFDSNGLFSSGHEMTVVFDEAFVNAHPVSNDIYPYFCTPHFQMGMTGTVRVLYRRKEFTATPSGWQVVPANENESAVDCELTVNENETEITYSCESLPGLVSGALYTGAIGQAGSPISGCTFSSLSPPSGGCAVDSSIVTTIINGGAYIELQTASSKLRGQVTMAGGSFSVYGRVSLQSAQGVENVTMTAGTVEAVTDENGYFAFSDMPNGVYQIRGDIEGYQVLPLPGASPLVINNSHVYNRLFIATESTEKPPLDPEDFAPVDFEGDGITDPSTALKDFSQGILQLSRLSEAEAIQTEILGISALASVAADYDGDGLADRAVVSLQEGALKWNITASSSELESEIIFGDSKSRLLTGCDFNGDDADELSIVNGTRLLFRGTTSDTESEIVLPAVAKILKATCGDVNGDGVDEFIVLERRKGAASRRARARSAKSQDKIRAINVATGSSLLSVRVTNPKLLLAPDMNRDGKAEIAVLLQHSQRGKMMLEGRALGSRRKMKVELPKIRVISVATLRAADESAQPGILYVTPAGEVFAVNFLDNQREPLFSLEPEEALLRHRELIPVL